MDWHVWSGMAIAGDGLLIVSDNSGFLRGVRDGVEQWSSARPGAPPWEGALLDTVAIAPNGTIYAGSWTYDLVAMR